MWRNNITKWTPNVKRILRNNGVMRGVCEGGQAAAAWTVPTERDPPAMEGRADFTPTSYVGGTSTMALKYSVIPARFKRVSRSWTLCNQGQSSCLVLDSRLKPVPLGGTRFRPKNWDEISSPKVTDSSQRKFRILRKWAENLGQPSAGKRSSPIQYSICPIAESLQPFPQLFGLTSRVEISKV